MQRDIADRHDLFQRIALLRDPHDLSRFQVGDRALKFGVGCAGNGSKFQEGQGAIGGEKTHHLSDVVTSLCVSAHRHRVHLVTALAPILNADARGLIPTKLLQLLLQLSGYRYLALSILFSSWELPYPSIARVRPQEVESSAFPAWNNTKCQARRYSQPSKSCGFAVAGTSRNWPSALTFPRRRSER